MESMTAYVKNATDPTQIQLVEHELKKMDGIERVLTDTNDGEIKIEFNSRQLTQKEIISKIQELHAHLILEDQS
ncbi:hypothetical protein [Heyndrickxia acidiproducens]|uniref:hypothetical protein n=1 Tax=Heyndrickxia acidiproducens TaxID=1121084 RepID=UPI000361976A|nr:hypothetical protein [Heyndrickxia acidiproducens]